jgi:hypothetical protein
VSNNWNLIGIGMVGEEGFGILYCTYSQYKKLTAVLVLYSSIYVILVLFFDLASELLRTVQVLLARLLLLAS